MEGRRGDVVPDQGQVVEGVGYQGDRQGRLPEATTPPP